MDFIKSSKIYFLIVFLTSILFFAQKIDSKNQKISELLDYTERLYIDGKTEKVLAESQKLISLSEKSDDQMGLSCGYYYFAACLYTVGKYRESINYIKKALSNKDYLKKDIMHHSRVYGLLADNYLSLELYSLSSESYHKSLQILQKVPNKNTLYYLSESTSYSYLAILYDNMNLQDSMCYYLKKEKNSLAKIKEKKEYPENGCASNDFGHYYLKINKLDSAKVYLNESLTFFKNEDNACKFDAITGLADIEIKNKNYQKAYELYNEALDGLMKNHYPQLLNNLYKKISEAYIEEGNTVKGKYYQDLYQKANLEMDEVRKKERDFVINEVMKEEERNNEIEKERNKIYTLLMISILLIIAAIIIYFLRKNKKRNINAQKITDKLKIENAIQEIEKDVLKNQINESFDDVMSLAKENSPQFFIRFQEKQPQFTPKMLKINPNFKVTELTFASYIYLGFSTKEIADYTFKAIKTIENNRYNFRKKLELSPDQDLLLWLRNYIDGE